MKLFLTVTVVVLLVACVASDKAPPKGQAQNQKGDHNPAKQEIAKPESGSGRKDQAEAGKPQSGKQQGGAPPKQSNGQDQGKKTNQDAKPANNKPENKNNRQ